MKKIVCLLLFLLPITVFGLEVNLKMHSDGKLVCHNAVQKDVQPSVMIFQCESLTLESETVVAPPPVPEPEPEGPIRAVLMDNMHTYLGNPVEEQRFFSFVSSHNITEMTLYTGGPVANRIIPERSALLVAFIVKAKQAGITHVGVATGSNQEVDRVINFQRNTGIKWDSLWLEYEWWNHNPRDFEKATNNIIYMRQRALPETKIGAYIGWTTKEEMHRLAHLTDRIYIHSYNWNGNSMFPRAKQRIEWLNDYELSPLRKPVQIFGLFSAEWRPINICTQPKTTPGWYDYMCFMGPWLRDYGFDSVEKRYTTNLDNTGFSGLDSVYKLGGFYYFAWTHIRDNVLK